MLRELPNAASWSYFAFDVSVKATLLLLVVAALMPFFARSSAAVRHRIWSLTFAGLLLLPLASSALPGWSWQIIPRDWQPAIGAASVGDDGPISLPLNVVTPRGSKETLLASATTPAAESGVDAVLSEVGGVSSATPADRQRAIRDLAATAAVPEAFAARGISVAVASTLLLLLPSIWLAGACFVLLPLVGGTLRNLRLRFFGDLLNDPGWQSLVEESRRHLGLRRGVTLVAGRTDQMPMTFGWLKPFVVLPAAAANWSAERRQMVLLHELAHVHRCDVPVQIIARLASAVYWFHPLVWWALRRTRLERELASDDCVLMAGQTASTYAMELLEIARTHRMRLSLASAALSMARPTQLEGRLLAVLDATRSRAPVTMLRTAGISSVVVLLVIALGIPRAALQADASEDAKSIASVGSDRSRGDISGSSATTRDSLANDEQNGANDRSVTNLQAIDSNSTVSVTASQASASEPSETGVLTFARNSTAGELVVRYTVGGTATRATDYVALSGTVTIPEGSPTAAVTVTPVDDSTVDGDETVVVTISPGDNYEIASSNTATVTIADDELPPQTGRWRFDKNLDDRVGSHPGSFNGGTPVYGDGKTGQSLHLDGVDDHLEIPYAKNLQALTMMAWVKPSKVAAISIMSRGSAINLGGADSPAVLEGSNMVRISRDGKFEYFIYATDSSHVLTGTTIVQRDTWYHVAAVASNDGMMRLYVNGVEEGTAQSIATMWDAGDRFRVGVGYGWFGFDYFDGLIDDLLVYEHALSAANIRAIYNEPIVNVTATDAIAASPRETGTFTFAHTNTTGDLVVNYTVSGTADGGSDYAALAGSVTIPHGSSTATVTVTPIDVRPANGEETVIVAIAPSTNYGIGPSNTAMVTIADHALPTATDKSRSDDILDAPTDADDGGIDTDPANDAAHKLGQAVDLSGTDKGTLEIGYTIASCEVLLTEQSLL